MIQDNQLLDDFHSLPPDEQAEVIDFIGYFLLNQSARQSLSRGSYGYLKDNLKCQMISMKSLEDFKDFM